MAIMSTRAPLPTYFFALVVVRLGHRFLIVHERKHGQLWYLPAGRVEAGESLIDAACRETLEETGVPIVPEGILRIEHSTVSGGVRCRVFFVARPKDDTPPKHVPDAESLEAAWVSLDELARYPLRGDEVADIFRYVANGGPSYPLSLLCAEGTRWDLGPLTK
jgi:8-oxo-dGTP pyrophosphatase MutT (NUDIX family)